MRAAPAGDAFASRSFTGMWTVGLWTMSQDVRTFDAEVHSLLECRLLLGDKRVIADDVVHFHFQNMQALTSA
jgi:hypothetical protein